MTVATEYTSYSTADQTCFTELTRDTYIFDSRPNHHHHNVRGGDDDTTCYTKIEETIYEDETSTEASTDCETSHDFSQSTHDYSESTEGRTNYTTDHSEYTEEEEGNRSEYTEATSQSTHYRRKYSYGEILYPNTSSEDQTSQTSSNRSDYTGYSSQYTDDQIIYTVRTADESECTEEFEVSLNDWSHADDASREMPWTDSKNSSLLSILTEEECAKDCDLIIVGMFAPAEDDDASEMGGSSSGGSGRNRNREPPQPVLLGTAAALDDYLGGALSVLLLKQYKVFKHGALVGSMTPTIRISVGYGKKTKKYILLGLGTQDKEVEPTTLFEVGSALASACKQDDKIKSCALHMPSKLGSSTTTLTNIASSFYSAFYKDSRYNVGIQFKNNTKPRLSSVILVPENDISASSQVEADAALAAGYSISKGIYLACDIVNAPHSILNSVSLANTARRIAEESHGLIECIILGQEECEKRGMGSYLAVGRGSESEPQFIHLTYRPLDGIINKKVGVVGNGLLLDTRGHNTTFDYGGAAAVLGAARATAALAPSGVEAHFIVASCENMIGGRSRLPTNVLTASNGMTIEVNADDDAEGLLTIADALVYAEKEVGCKEIIELSASTGACMVILGTGYAGVFTQNNDLADEIESISKVTGDKTWRMPLVENEYNSKLRSRVADIKNCGTRYGGAITAGLFLKKFVKKKRPFAHIDIAGPVWKENTGATGFGAKLVTEWVCRKGRKDEILGIVVGA
uniref:Cytosol aminopeptidase domain-containing protein n=1 Tax=Ditylum brightwellii TaxID=49249 RepID=A0A7S2ES42_9STRA|mmetsp:Transcript_5224/g.7974  ORF Transcript_5224/g.7974 Transcript_5224/m.7974 type:complete len:746 (+) Transcript_5224:788-3025(+)